MDIICRKHEIKVLNRIFKSSHPEFLAIYGRRRVGKTFLIRSYFNKKKCIFFSAAGLKDGNYQEQLANFAMRISEVFLDGITVKIPDNWGDMFKLLCDAINRIDKDKKVVIFLDELPWMATKRSKLLQTLDYYWNQYWSTESRIKLIVCGSSASWIIDKIINNKGGLYNRITESIHLQPFNLAETEEYLAEMKSKLNRKQVTELYMLTGGVPFYLSKVERGFSATQNIEMMAFNQKALLLNEFDALFESLFEHSDSYIEIVKTVAAHKDGIGQQDLFKKLKKTPQGETSIRRVKHLEDAGFIISFMPHFHKRRGIYYRMIDEYASFYLNWLLPLKSTKMVRALESNYWKTVSESPRWYSWAGYAFENICYKHLTQIRKALKISPTAVPNSWRYTPKPGSYSEGAQIDLLFDREDDSITICEIKFTKTAYVITKSYAQALKKKLAVFKQVTGTKKQLFIALISANGVKHNIYSEELLSAVITLDDLFN